LPNLSLIEPSVRTFDLSNFNFDVIRANPEAHPRPEVRTLLDPEADPLRTGADEEAELQELEERGRRRRPS
jgi:hypothetical protein